MINLPCISRKEIYAQSGLQEELVDLGAPSRWTEDAPVKRNPAENDFGSRLV